MSASMQAIQVEFLPKQYFFVPIDHAPKSFFKALFLGTHLGEAAARMSHAQVAPEGLKPQECEMNMGRSRPPIPYIPEKDVIQEVVDSSTNTLKLMLPHKVELHVPVWLKETPGQFLVHIQQALYAIRQKGLQTALEKVIKDKVEYTKRLVEANEALENYKARTRTPPQEESGAKSH